MQIDVQSDGLQEPMYRFFDKLRNMLQPTGTENVRNSNAAKAADIYTKYLVSNMIQPLEFIIINNRQLI